MNVVNVTVNAKKLLYSQQNEHLICRSIHVIDVQEQKYWAQHRSLWRPNVIFEIEKQYLIETYCFLLLKENLKQLCMTSLMPLCSSLLINMS